MSGSAATLKSKTNKTIESYKAVRLVGKIFGMKALLLILVFCVRNNLKPRLKHAKLINYFVRF